MAKRLPRPEPITFEEIASLPSLKGFGEFLRYRPGDAVAAVIPFPEPTVGLESKPTVGSKQTPTVGFETAPTVGPEPGPTVDLGSALTVDNKSEPAAGSNPTPTVGFEPEPTVGLETEPTVNPAADPESELAVLSGIFYLAEDLGALFPVTRIKRIGRAQDALTVKEEAVYDVLWKSGDVQGLSTWSYTDLADHKEVRSDKRNVAKLVGRLVQKGFIEIARQGGGARTQKTVYRAFGYGAVLQTQRERGVCGVIKTGNGVFYALKMSLPGPTVGPGSQPTVDRSSQPSVDRSSQPTVDRRPPPSLVQRTLVQEPTSSSELLDSTPDFDDDARQQLVAKCRKLAPDVTQAEIADATRKKRAQLFTGRKRIDNPVGLLLEAVPKAITGAGLSQLRAKRAELAREAEERQRRQEAETAERIAEWQRILADPAAEEDMKALVRDCLKLSSPTPR
jgi:hypothetical protein